MKRIVILTITTLAIASGHAFSEELTRAQVHEEMVQYKAAGFNPARQNPRTWVDDAQRASAKVTEARVNSDQPLHEASDSTASQR
jgi:hypothetical protein